MAIIMALCLPSLRAADWTDNEDGTWSCVTVECGTVTVPTEGKNKLEKCRASDNFRFRYMEDQLSPSAWLDALKTGLVDTRHNYAVMYHYGVPAPDSGDENWWQVLWGKFLDRYVWPQHPDRDTAGMAVEIDPPLYEP
jgi:hypothetical protein